MGKDSRDEGEALASEVISWTRNGAPRCGSFAARLVVEIAANGGDRRPDCGCHSSRLPLDTAIWGVAMATSMS